MNLFNIIFNTQPIDFIEEKGQGGDENQVYHKIKKNLSKFDSNTELSEEWIKIALSEGIHRTWVESVFRRFKEWYTGKTGTVVLKSDWKAVWRNWCEDDAPKRSLPKKLWDPEMAEKPFLAQGLEGSSAKTQTTPLNLDDPDPIIKTIKRKMLVEAGEPIYRSWINNLDFEISDLTLIVYAPSQLHLDELKAKYAEMIKKCSAFENIKFSIRKPKPSYKNHEQKDEASYPVFDENPAALTMRQKILDRLGAQFYRSNIERTRFEVQQGFLKIYTKSQNSICYIQKKLDEIYIALEGMVTQIDIAVDPDRVGSNGWARAY